MSEYISREAAIKTADHAYNEWNLAMAAADSKREINLVYKRQELCKAVASVFENAPTIDVERPTKTQFKRMTVQLGYEQVVRCKDCKYSYEGISGRTCVYGPPVDCIVQDNFYCANGERKEK